MMDLRRDKYQHYLACNLKGIIISYKGRYSPINSSKYVGDPTKIYYRSLWERKFMKYCDDSPNVIQWSSEEIQIPYYSPVDQRFHRYFVDFWIKIREKNGDIKCKLIEIKPFKQTMQPTKPEKATRRYLKEIKTWIINTNKWNAATEFCEKKEWEFVILTEKHLFKNAK